MSLPALYPWQVSVIDAISMLVLVTASIISITRSIQLAIRVYIVQALMIVILFATIGVKYLWFVWWSISAAITKALIVPLVLTWVVKHTSYITEREEPFVSRAVYIIIIVLVCILSAVIAREILVHVPKVVSGTSSSLASALTLTLIGLTTVSLSRNALKQILGVVMFENGSHILLAALAFYVPESVEVGVSTDAVFMVSVLAYLSYRMVKIRGNMDVSKLTALKY